jgi:hypothetical protein
MLQAPGSWTDRVYFDGRLAESSHENLFSGLAAGRGREGLLRLEADCFPVETASRPLRISAIHTGWLLFRKIIR